MIKSEYSDEFTGEPDTYLVTGCCGFIGSSFCIEVLKAGKKVIGIDNFTDFYPLNLKMNNLSELEKFEKFEFINIDISDPLATKQISQLEFCCMVHLAAQPGVRESITERNAYYKNNIIGTYNLLNALFFNGTKKLVFASSSSIYSDMNETPYVESEKNLLPGSPYGVTKLFGERILKLSKNLGIDTLALRFFSVYGPRQRPDLLIPKIFQAGIDNGVINIFGKGNSTRDFTYVGDIVKAIRLSAIYTMKNHNIFEIINVGSGKPVSVNDIMLICEKVMQKEVNKKHLPAFSFENNVTWANGNKINNLLGFQPEYDLKKGLKEHWDWIESTVSTL